MNLERTPTRAMNYSPILRVWCVLTCGVTFALIGVGTLVTTFKVGMADPIWPTAPWHLFLTQWEEPRSGYLVEHTHRLVGWITGVFILVQTAAIWWSAPSSLRRWTALVLMIAVGTGSGIGMRLVKLAPQRSVEALGNWGFTLAAAGAVAFLVLAIAELMSGSAGRWPRALVAVVYIGVIAQGMFGGLRVYLNELQGPELAIIHGLFAQVVFTLTALLVVMTSVRWNRGTEMLAEPRLRWLAAGTVILLMAQIVFGGLLRHLSLPLAQRLHPMLAFAIAAMVAIILVRIFALGEGWASMRPIAVLLGVLVGLQAMLGVEAWLRHSLIANQFQPIGVEDAAIRSLHVLTGFGVFAAATVLAARAWKAKWI